MIDQLTVFLTNESGRLAAMCKAIGNAGIQMHALLVADTTDYGIVRIVCDNPERALSTLTTEGFSACLTKVVAVDVPNVPGGLAQVLEALDSANLNIEYSYCFAGQNNQASVVIKTDEHAVSALEAAGFNVLHPSDLYVV